MEFIDYGGLILVAERSKRSVPHHKALLVSKSIQLEASVIQYHGAHAAMRQER